MNFVVPSTLIDMAVTFIIRQVDKFAETVDWTKVKADLDARLRDLIPGEFFDALAVAVMNKTVDVVAALLTDEDAMTQLVKLLRAKKHSDAFRFLRDYVASVLHI